MPGKHGTPRTPYQHPAHPTGAAASSAVVSVAVSIQGAVTGSTGVRSLVASSSALTGPSSTVTLVGSPCSTGAAARPHGSYFGQLSTHLGSNPLAATSSVSSISLTFVE